ncbi:MAG: hypothetical protein NUV56_01130 [Candidatus Uhrbacteria bacterium]|nr:hypothetical protein [Candidatus Uhrbacteria bacterium]
MLLISVCFMFVAVPVWHLVHYLMRRPLLVPLGLDVAIVLMMLTTMYILAGQDIPSRDLMLILALGILSVGATVVLTIERRTMAR